VPGGSAAVSASDKFSARALLNNKQIHVDAGLARSTIVWPSPFLLNVAPMVGFPIEGCEASATVQKPDNTSEVISLHDDGVDGDDDAHDGLYTASYRNFTARDGIYTFLVRVSCRKESAYTVNRGNRGAGEPGLNSEIPTFERTIRFSGIVSGVPDNLPPVAKICGDVHLECKGTPTPVALDGTCSFDPEGAPLSYMWSSPTGSFFVPTETQPTGHFQLGYNFVQLEVADANGEVSLPDVGVVVVADTTAPVIQSLTATPSSLWPPNHHMAPVTLTVDAVEACDPSYVCEITSVTSNEKPECDDDGNPQVDWEITGPLSLKLRKEKGKKEKERIYTVSVTCTDASGNPSTADVAIAVEKPKGNLEWLRYCVILEPTSAKRVPFGARRPALACGPP
jgi:hypothetical protein